MIRPTSELPRDVQILDLIWIDPAAMGLAKSAAANLDNLLRQARTNYVLLHASSPLAQTLAALGDADVHSVPIRGPAGALKREVCVLWLAARALLAGRAVVYTSWLPRLCFVVLALPITCRLFVHDLNIFRPRIYDAEFRRPSLLSRLHQYLSIKRATAAQCFARSVARQLRLLRAAPTPVVEQSVRIVPTGRVQRSDEGAVIFLDERAYKGTWALDRFYSSKPGFPLTVIGKIDADHVRRLAARGISAQALRPSDEEKFERLAAAPYVIFASRYEGYGLPPREAAAVGTPSLIARRAALLDIPRTLSLSIDALGPRIDLAAIPRLMAGIDRTALRQWMAESDARVRATWSSAEPDAAESRAPAPLERERNAVRP